MPVAPECDCGSGRKGKASADTVRTVRGLDEVGPIMFGKTNPMCAGRPGKRRGENPSQNASRTSALKDYQLTFDPLELSQLIAILQAISYPQP
jgi:hypothetical protein